ncbi:MAG: hypothetical protein AAB853_02710, partial [Patescibacteria group bacterium]
NHGQNEDRFKIELEKSDQEAQRETARARLAHALTFMRELLLQREGILGQEIAIGGTIFSAEKGLTQER